jgi:hypothetical protein
MAELSLAARNAALIGSLIPHLSVQPWFELAPLARAAGASEWTIRRAFGQIETLYRSAFSSLAKEIAVTAARIEKPEATVIETIRTSALAFADLMRAPAYLAMLRLLLQNGGRYPWMAEEYHSLIKGLASGLQRRIALVADNYRKSIGLSDKTALGFLRAIEVHAALRQLMPDLADDSPDLAMVLKPLIAQAYEATYQLDWVRA